MTILHPERPLFASGPEQQVWDLLRQQLRAQDVLMSGLRVTDHTKDHEADVVVLLPGTGVVVLEVKGGSVWFDGHRWRQHRGGTDYTVHRSTKPAKRSTPSGTLWRPIHDGTQVGVGG